ncbi:MAG: aspartyl/glutamyl-tRNA amidotransferase subunit C [Candidatus Kaiserbacteria bacterium]|nr:aspartyl/glutamyl-tRNA amidotransferase subunit C [Candidatus Kaiserbacteria bacterium]
MAEDDIKRSVRLSLLEGGKGEEQFADEIADILTFVGEVQEIAVSEDVSDVKQNVFRDDTVTVSEGTYREPFLSQAPSRFKNWLVSKKIL